ncbi:hypothetical protein [Streptomyces sp. NPDC002644]
MSSVPAWLLRHRVTITPLLGTGAYGPTWGDPVSDIPALVSYQHVMTRDRTGAQVASTAQVICRPDVHCPTGSRIVLPDGRTTTAISVGRHTAPGLPVPESTEVMCQ